MLARPWFRTICCISLTRLVLRNSNTGAFRTAAVSRNALRRVAGEVLFVAEADVHRAQRRLMNTVFGRTQIRRLSGIFLDKINEVRLITIYDVVI
jgi:cytochrome P450